MEKLFLSRSNLLALLSKLDRAKAGEATARTIIKRVNPADPFVNTAEIAVTAVEDEDLYVVRAAGPIHPLDSHGKHLPPGGKKPDVHTRDAPSSRPEIEIKMSWLVESPLLVGREFGAAMRENANLDIKDLDAGRVYKFVIDDTTYSMSSSFFMGMFEESIVNLGEEKFRERYKFDVPLYMESVINSCIIRIKQLNGLP